MRVRVIAFFVAFAAVPVLLVSAASAQVVALGASNTQGQGVGVAAAFPAQLQALLKAQGLNVSVANAGISGDTTAGMLARFGSAVPSGTKVVILQFGGNDQRRGISPQQRQANIAEMHQKLRTRGIAAVEADAHVTASLRAGLKQADNIHLTAEGHRQVAQNLLSSVAAGLR